MADREHRDRPIAYGWFPVENIENYKTFLKMVISNPRTAALINRVGVACMHDRHLSFESVIREILDKVLDRFDIIHIIRNCRKYFPKMNLNPLVLAAFAKTESDHNKYFESLDISIIDYIKDIPKYKYCTYAAAEKGLQINGEKTSNRVEQEMIRTVKVGIRHEDPLTGLVRIAEEFSRLQSAHQRTANLLIEMNQTLIPFASSHYEYVKNRASQGYEVKSVDGLQLIHVRYNSEECYRKDVNMIAEPYPTCSCKLLEIEGIVCAHIIAVYRVFLEDLKWSDSTTLGKFFHSQYFTSSYVKAFNSSIRRPDLATLIPSECLPPLVKEKRKGGSEKRKRFKSGIESTNRSHRKKKHSAVVVKGDSSILPKSVLIPKADSKIDNASSIFFKTISSITTSTINEFTNLVGAITMLSATDSKQECINTLEELEKASSNVDYIKTVVANLKLTMLNAYDLTKKVRYAVSTLATSNNRTPSAQNHASSSIGRIKTM